MGMGGAGGGGPGGPGGGGGGGRGGGGDGGGGGGGGRSFNPEAIVDRVMERNDKDEDGILSAEELEDISEQFRSRLTAADADEDGAISKDELLKYFTEQASQRGSGGDGRPGGGGGGRPGGSDSGQPEEADEGNPAEEPAEDSAQENQGGVFGSLLRAVGSGAQKAITASAATAPGADDEQ
jgi:Ca2+-binding EF-hand superfamily protein